jgi:hypothetical protein
MWIKAIFPVGVLAMAVVPRLVPGTAPGSFKTESLITTERQASFAAVCRNDEVLDSRPDPAWMQASFINDGCRMAPAPAVINGASASREQIVTAMAATKCYEAAADAFQKCISNFVAARRAGTAQAANALTPSQTLIENHRMLVSQRSKEIAAARVRVAINDFNRYGSDCPD